MSPVALARPAQERTGSSQPSRSIVTLSHSHRISIEGRPSGHLSHTLERLGHLPGGGLRRSGEPHEGYANPVMNDGSEFYSDIPISKLT